MRQLIVSMLVAAGVVVYADAVVARSGGAGGAGGGAGAGAAAGGAAGAGGTGAAAAGTSGGPGAAGDDSVVETGPGDRLGGPAAGYANDPSIHRSPDGLAGRVRVSFGKPAQRRDRGSVRHGRRWADDAPHVPRDQRRRPAQVLT